jgi:hypothetical protein
LRYDAVTERVNARASIRYTVRGARRFPRVLLFAASGGPAVQSISNPSSCSTHRGFNGPAATISRNGLAFVASLAGL